jgi:hypothetical protein
MDLEKYQHQVEENLKTLKKWKEEIKNSHDFEKAKHARTLEKSLENHLQTLDSITKISLKRKRKIKIEQTFKNLDL